MENLIDPKLIEDLKKASQEIEGLEKEKQKPIEIPKPPHQEIGGGGKEVSKKIDWDLENHLSEIVEARKKLEQKRNKIQSRLQFVVNLENRIRRVLSERKKLDEDLERMKNLENS